MSKHHKYEWNPQEDITVWELATALEAFIYPYGWLSIKGFPPEVKRHFKEVVSEDEKPNDQLKSIHDALIKLPQQIRDAMRAI